VPQHREVRWLPYSPEQMFDLVADVRAYPQFLPWVSAVRVRSDTEQEMLADLIVGFKGLRETFTSRVRRERPMQVQVDYVDGPLRHLANLWRFEPEGTGVRVHFQVEFAFKNRLFEMLAGQMFDSALRKMTAAFEARAAALYQPKDSGKNSSSAHSAA
jgi:coenzyme Q-binding protein COQ10